VRALPAAAVLLTAALAAGCSGGSSGSPATPGTAGASDAAKVAWNPCDGLTAAEVGRYVGERVTEHDGTDAQPRCTFTPQTKGGAAYDVSYLSFDGGLDAALGSMGAVARQLRPVRVPGAQAARLAVNTKRTGVLVTGFVQTKGLVQSVNAVQLAPYDEGAVVAATRRLLAALARKAPDPS